MTLPAGAIRDAAGSGGAILAFLMGGGAALVTGIVRWAIGAPHHEDAEPATVQASLGAGSASLSGRF